VAITNAQAVKFSNERLRVAADALATAYYTAKKVMQEYYADPALGDAYTAGIAETVADGADVDGRPLVTGNDALGLITRCSELVTDYEAGGNAKLNTVLGVSVNGTSKV
jgi:hypothetical protein